LNEEKEMNNKSLDKEVSNVRDKERDRDKDVGK